MTFKLWCSIGYDIFGLGIDLESVDLPGYFALLLGPFGISGGGPYWDISFTVFGKVVKIFH